MITRPVKYAWQHIRYVPLWSMLTVSRWRSFGTRSAALGRAVGGATTTLETLIPDFAGKWDNLQRIIDVSPEIVSHNLETVRRLTKAVRIQAKYDRSLELLFRLKKGGMKTKSGVMLGLGESEEEVIETMEDLRNVNVDILTLGQYLQPTPKHLPVSDFITPESFLNYKETGLKMGFRYVESGPLVRSSYRAEKHLF